MSDDTITLKLVAQDLMSGNVGKAVGSLDKMAQKGGIVGSVFQGMGQKLGQMLNPIGLVTQGIGMLTDVIGESIQKAMEEQVGIDKLAAALKANIPAWNGNTDAIEKVIAAREKLAFSDGEQRDTLAKLVTLTHDSTKALDLERLAMDLARLRGMSLADSATIIGKVYNGNVAILKRYGINVGNIKDSTKALAALQKQAAGQADTYANTTQGSFESLQIAIDDAEEAIGQKLLPTMKDLAVFARDELVPAVLQGINALSLVGDVTNLIAMMARMDPGALAAGQRLGQRISEGFGKGVEKGADAGKDAIGGAIASFLDPLPKAVVAVEGAVDAALRPIPGDFHDAFDPVAGIVKRTLHNARTKAKTEMAEIVDSLEHPLREAHLKTFYRNRIKEGTDAMNDALESGNADAYAKASKFVHDMQVKLNELVAADWAFRVTVNTNAGRPHLETTPGRAAGGPVLAGQSYRVGEHGEETLVMGRGMSGYVIPHRGGGGGTTINMPFVYAPQMSTASPREAQAMAEQFLPHIRRAAERNGVSVS